jgi:hypothetical protein
MKSITERFGVREIEYRVAFIDTTDSEGLPFTVRILVEPENQREFENWLENERDNSILHAEGGTVEY